MKSISSKLILIIAALFSSFALCGCSSKGGALPLSVYSIEGPPLYVIGEMDGEEYAGSMDRGCLVGFGKMEIGSYKNGLLCTGKLDAPMNQEGRLHGILKCNDGRFLVLSLRNIGPDQGFGIARMVQAKQLDSDKLSGPYSPMPIFYHPCKEEAKRRFVNIAEELKAVYTNQQAAVKK